jgi:hypothetical protein
MEVTRMHDTAIENAILTELRRLGSIEKERVLSFARALGGPRSLPPGVPGKSLLRFAGTIPPEDLREMEAAIEEACERIDPDGW